ncbi:hypothetical protein CAFE_17840 [Caprobacter fermentans]|uniref:Phage tail protein n=1 Tax=Caproicibacter fermentans TaxID=2576756 RepID=A0A6N8HZ88_9FIRM|nr:hypothetical protein [Caproicibacter fermentans]MVB11082.1 hypothetical protein [Caproicibacter fermentans]
MTQIFYEGTEISADVELSDLKVTDSCGDQADGIDAVFANSENQWSGWKPRKGDTLNIIHDGYRSGSMWIDRIRQETGTIQIGAVSIPTGGKTKQTRAWEKVSLITIAAQLAKEYGMTVKFLSVPNEVYSRVDQMGRGDFGFLRERAALEGCSLKIQDSELYLFSDVWLEGQPSVKTIDAADFLESPRFSDSAGETYGSCSVSWGKTGAVYTDSGGIGPELSVTDYPVSSAGEALRFAKNLLRNANKKGVTGEISIPLDTTVSAGNVIEISGTGLNDGKYLIDAAQHSFAEEISRFSLHQCFTRF